MRLAVAVFALVATLSCGGASAHATGSSQLDVSAPAAGPLAIRWDVPAIDLQAALELDQDGDGRLSAGEVSLARPALARLARRNLAVARGGAPCELGDAAAALAMRGTESFISLRLTANCARGGALELATALFFESPGYSALFEVRTPEGRYSGVLSPAGNRWRQPGAPAALGTFLRFLREGARHVLIGYDHVAFLLLLLLPSVLMGRRGGWLPAADRGAVMRELVRIVTAFTIAHSVTLGLAATETVTLPARPIELAIAASIVAAGILNLFPAAARFRLPLAFGFGFVHGLGFANALSGIGGPGLRVVPMLAGFNLGVEAAQLLIVAVALPILLFARRVPLYRRRLMPALSLATGCLGAFWLIARF